MMSRQTSLLSGKSRLPNILFAFATVVAFAVAAPHHGERMLFDQPDGSQVPVILHGDEFHIDAESPDGYTLVRGGDGWICYAELSADGSEYVSSGVRYTGTSRAPNIRKGLRISAQAVGEKQRRNREVLGYDELIAPTDFSRSFTPRAARTLRKAQGGADGGEDVSHAPAAEPRRIVGLMLLIQFPDQPVSSISQTAMEEFCNRRGGFNGNAAAGSAYDYFYDVSNGLVEYVNIVTPFIVVDSARRFYDNGTTGYQRVPHLITHALRKLRDSGFDISELTTETTGSGANARRTAVALNIFYAGASPATWATGIWPHSGTYRAPTGETAVTIDGISFGRYQMSSLGTGSNPPGIGTFVHENGHMIMRWPDLYPYSDAQVVPPAYVGGYCVMGSTNGNNPQMPNPHFRNMAGWIDVVNITDMDTTLTHVANSHTAYRFVRNNRESYFIEARRRVGRSANIPGEGLIVWHIDTSGNNTNHNTVKFPHVAVVKADNGSGAPGANAPFRAGSGSRNTEFNSSTTPAAIYHDGVLSNIRVSEVSAASDLMSFKIGGMEGGPRTYYLMVENGTGGGYYEAGTEVGISAQATNDLGRYFFRWTSSNITLDDAYTRETFVTMDAREASVTAQFVRGHVLPGQVEADTAALLAGITSTSSNSGSASGGRTARIQNADTTRYAMYVVDVAEDGEYDLSYRLLVNRSSTGSIYISDVTNNVTLDTVIVSPTTSTTYSLQTVAGKTVRLKKGAAVWRLEAPPGTVVQIDWFAAEDANHVTPANRSVDIDRFSYDIKALSSGRIVYSVPTSGNVSVKMYDIRGRTVAVLANGARDRGVYNVNVGGARRGLGQGMYIIRMRADGYAKDIKFNYRR